MILDANILIYAADRSSPFHARSASWLAETLEGDRRVAIPLQTVGAFVRIITHPRASRQPLSVERAWTVVNGWFAAPTVWVPTTSEHTVKILGDLMLRHHLSSGMTTDSQLAALAVEHGVPIVSADSDFARFPEVVWINPLTVALKN